MLKTLDRYLILEIFKTFFMFLLFFFPILYLADFFIQDSFSHIDALKKLTFRYNQILSTIIILTATISMKKLRHRYGDLAFLTIGFKKRDITASALVFSLFLIYCYSFFVIPSNEYFFNEKLNITNWGIKQQGSTILYFHRKNENNFEIWAFPKDKKIKLYKDVIVSKNYLKTEDSSYEFEFKNEDFYIIWNDLNKLSWKGLKNFQKYQEYHNLNSEEAIKQYHMNLSKIVLIFAMVLCGLILGFENSYINLLIVCVLSNWFDQISFILPLKYSIFFYWFNAIIWVFFSLCLLI